LYFPRHRFDIQADDLLWGLLRCASGPPCREDPCEERLGPGALVALSARSAFDLYLQAAALPPGEVLVTGVNIPDMARILEKHGQTVVPVDLDPATLAPCLDDLERLVTPRTRALLAAHLLGGRIPVEPLARFCQRRGLLLLEDCAQAFRGHEPGAMGHPGAALSLWSFGPIKTATALGGGLAYVRDPATLARMKHLRRAQPTQPTGPYAARLARTLLMVGAQGPRVYHHLTRAVRRAGFDLEALTQRASRGFAGASDFFEAIRHRPSAPLVALLERRIFAGDDRRVVARQQAGEALRAALAGRVPLLGGDLDQRTHWLVCALAPDPARFVAALRSAGFEAVRDATTIGPVGAPHAAPPRCLRAMQQAVFLPAYPEMPARARLRLAGAAVDAAA